MMRLMSNDNVTHWISIIEFITNTLIKRLKAGNKLNTNGDAHDNRQN